MKAAPKYRIARDGIRSSYRAIYRKTRCSRVIGCYMTKSERWEQHKESEKAVVAGWPPLRIKELKNRTSVSLYRLCAILGVNKRTFKRLCAGAYTPSASLCRRMSLIEQMSDNGTLAPDIVPRKAEARRRLMLFRAWWYDQPPKKELPEVTFHVKVTWGKGKLNYVELPIIFLPRLRLLKWEGLVEVVRELVKTCRKIGHQNGRLLWKTVDEEYWKRYATSTLPEIVEQRASLPKRAAHFRWNKKDYEGRRKTISQK